MGDLNFRPMTGYKCDSCGMVFRNRQQLGGHISQGNCRRAISVISDAATDSSENVAGSSELSSASLTGDRSADEDEELTDATAPSPSTIQ